MLQVASYPFKTRWPDVAAFTATAAWFTVISGHSPHQPNGRVDSYVALVWSGVGPD